ncbi:hypothetical protein MMPV_007698 [Pyropia vietnamensis]
MWVEKYRPAKLDDLLSHTDIVRTLRRLIASARLPHLLFCGPPGTGKTSTILACAREMYGSAYGAMVLELNASDERGIDVVRERIKSFASTRRIFSRGVKLIVLDEADAMTGAAQAALRRVIEKHTANVRFCLICNYVNKIIPAVQSRCTRFRFAPLPSSDVSGRLTEIAAAEGVVLGDGGLAALMELGAGDMRRCVHLLQSAHMASCAEAAAAAETAAAAGGDTPPPGPIPITREAVYANAGAPLPSDVQVVADWLLNEPFPVCVARLTALQTDKGFAMDDICRQLVEMVLLMPLPAAAKCYLLEHLAEVEYRMAGGGSVALNTLSLVGAFKFGMLLTRNAEVKAMDET